MASPDESRVDEARDQSGAPASPDPIPGPSTPDADAAPPPPRLNGGAAADEPSEAVSPGRPRGTASFPGGAPPATAAPAEVAIPSAPPPPPTAPPSFRVTTVEPTAASFPGGPPPPAPPESDAPTRPAEHRPATVSPDGAVPPAPAAAPTPAAPAPAAATPTPTAPATGATPAAPEGEAAGRDGPPAPAVDQAGESGPPASATGVSGRTAPVRPPDQPERADVPAAGQPGRAGAETEVAEAGGGRTGGRRRRRGRGGRTSAAVDPAAEVSGPEAVASAATLAAPDEAAEASAGPGASGRQAAARERDDGEAPDGDAAEDRDAAAVSPAGSARTRARRRRRAAAKVRTREPGANASVDEPAVAPAPDSRPAGPGADDRPTGRRSRRAAPAAEVPADATQGQDEAAPAARSASRTSRRGGAAAARAAAAEPLAANGETAAEPRAARPAEPQPGRGANREPSGAGAGSERGGRTRRRGRGRLAATKDDAATATAAPEAAPARPATSERSTRLETRGRSGRQADRGRRRPRGLTEEQKRVLREEGPDKRMLVTEGAERTQIGVLEGETLVEHYVTRKAGRSMVGNIYLGRVQNVLPGMEAAFIDIGRGRNAVLYAGEVNYNEEDLDGEAPRIERVLKAGQPVLVQVTKDPIGAKGARLTAQVSLAGRYLVLQPEDNTFGISRRLPEEERSRLRDILKEVRPKGLGLIARTAAEGAGADDLRADLARLQARWEAVERKAKKASAPAVIYSEPELVVRVIRDIFSPDFAELVVDDDELYQRVHEYLQEVAPDLLPKLRKHDGALPLFEDYRVVEQIHKALERKVWLPSGGSIVIDRTEAMTVVDVNTGKFVGRANLEETVVANNLEAADEVVRQLRLRDIGGIIIIDFIDMLFERNQQAVVDRLRDALTRDKTKSQVMEVSSLGLVQMTRKRVSGGLLDSFSETCPTCDGRGVVITHEIQ
jgi:ribonuclease E